MACLAISALEVKPCLPTSLSISSAKLSGNLNPLLSSRGFVKFYTSYSTS